MKQIIINELPVEIEKKRIKNMYLKILPPDGRIHISAPIRMSEDEIRRFIISKYDWIISRQNKLKYRDVPQDISYINGDTVFFHGKKYILSVIEQNKRTGIILEGENMLLTSRTGSTKDQRKKILDHWYREILMTEIPPLLQQWENAIGVKASGFSIRDMKSRWGTCNIRSRVITLNLRLAEKPSACLEYVIVHELVHLLEKSHNSIFKGYMDRFLPGWRGIKKELNGFIDS